MDDPRPGELLEECARIDFELGLKLTWSDALRGAAAKACSRGGSANWKRAAALPAEEGAAVAYFVSRARKRNPAVPAAASGLLIVEVDLDVPDDAYPPDDEVEARVVALLDRCGVVLPPTTTVRSRRGWHLYLQPPPGAAPLKVQVSETDGIAPSRDGYVIGAPGLHEVEGVVYRYLRNGRPAPCPREMYELLVERGEQAREQAWIDVNAGEPIAEGSRNESIFHLALELVREGKAKAEILARLLVVNREQCRPPLAVGLVEKQLAGARKWAREHPTPEELSSAKARNVLAELRAGTREAVPEKKRERKGVFLPFADVHLTGPPRWLWRGKVPEGAVTLVAGRPKLGKSLFAIWLAAQLSRGLLEGSYHELPARTLIIAAEDPPDPIVKGRLIAAAADQVLVGTLVQGHQDHHPSPQDDLDGLDGLDGAGAYARRITIPDEYGLLEEIVVEHGIALVVLDPINSFLSAKIDAHRDAEIRRVLDPLAHLSAKRRFSSLAIVHLNRRSDTDILSRITGSGGYGGSARLILTFGRHPEHDEQRVVASEGNWQKTAQSDLFELREVIVFPDAAPEEQTQPALVHIGVIDLDSKDLIDDLTDDRSALEEAKDFLRGELVGGAVPVADLRRGADANGHSWPTVERAKKLLSVEARRISSTGSPRGAGRWEWFLELVEEES